MRRGKHVSSLLALALVGSVMLLTACLETPKRKLGEGAKTTAPIGESTLCKEQPEHNLCL
jgi:hypothetical protein